MAPELLLDPKQRFLLQVSRARCSICPPWPKRPWLPCTRLEGWALGMAGQNNDGKINLVERVSRWNIYIVNRWENRYWWLTIDGSIMGKSWLIDVDTHFLNGFWWLLRLGFSNKKSWVPSTEERLESGTADLLISDVFFIAAAVLAGWIFRKWRRPSCRTLPTIQWVPMGAPTKALLSLLS